MNEQAAQLLQTAIDALMQLQEMMAGGPAEGQGGGGEVPVDLAALTGQGGGQGANR